MHPHSNSDEFSHIMQFLRMVSWKVGWSAGAIPRIIVLTLQVQSKNFLGSARILMGQLQFIPATIVGWSAGTLDGQLQSIPITIVWWSAEGQLEKPRKTTDFYFTGSAGFRVNQIPITVILLNILPLFRVFMLTTLGKVVKIFPSLIAIAQLVLSNAKQYLNGMPFQGS